MPTCKSDGNVQDSSIEWFVSASDPREIASIDLYRLDCSAGLLIESRDALKLPKRFSIGMDVRGGGGTEAMVALRQKRVPRQAIVQYLWRCHHHGNMDVGGEFLIFPSDVTAAFPVAQGKGGRKVDAAI